MFRILLLLAALFSGPSLANENFPNRPIRAIVPFAPGGAADVVMRVIATRMSESIGQPVVVDNRAGGGTVLATGLVAQAPPDGYTLLVVTAAFAANHSLQAKLPYDTIKSFTPVTQTFSAPNMLVARSDLPVASVADLIKYAKQNPGKLSYGSAGVGTSNHLAAEMFRAMAGLDMVHVPYKGDAPAVLDLVSGRIDVMFTSVAPVEQHIKSGRIKALGVSSLAPFSLVPNLPTVASGGVAGFEATIWNGIVVPAGTPVAVVSKLHAELTKALSHPEVKDRIRSMGFETVGSSPSSFGNFLSEQIESSAKVVKAANIKAE